MDVEHLKKIVEIMNDNDLAELEIEEEGKRLRLRKAESAPVPVPMALPGVPAPVAAPAPVAVPAAAPADAAAPAADDGMHTIRAPMVGTFYRAPSPDAETYIEVGQKVNPESIVCILEAMKVMNEIKAECSGTVVKVLVQNAEAVEYDQPLMLVQPD